MSVSADGRVAESSSTRPFDLARQVTVVLAALLVPGSTFLPAPDRSSAHR